MGTLASQLAPHAQRLSPKPRIYADANMPARLVAYMRDTLGWDVLFVLEDPTLRRASDLAHYEFARQLQRTLITLDHDYLDDQRFPPASGSGVIVVSGPDERRLCLLLARIHKVLFDGDTATALPLDGRKLEAHTDWRRDLS